jgi:hypothetical protein
MGNARSTTPPALATYADCAALARRVGATDLADALERWQPGEVMPALALTDERKSLNRFRATLERHGRVQISSDGSGGTWGYAPQGTYRRRVFGFVHLQHALLAGVRSVVAPLGEDQMFEERTATAEELSGLLFSYPGQPDDASLWRLQARRFRMLSDCRHYYDLPHAWMLLQFFREPAEAGQGTPSLAGFAFYGDEVIGVMEALYSGGGSRMIRWLQGRHKRLIGHDILSESTVAFLSRHGFVYVSPPLPAEALDDLPRREARVRQLADVKRKLGRANPSEEEIQDNIRQGFYRRVMAWPESATDDLWVADRLRSCEKPWWRPEKKHAPSPEAQLRAMDFVRRVRGSEK